MDKFNNTVRFEKVNNFVFAFQQIHTMYKFNLIRERDWVGSKLCSFKKLKSPQWLRNLKTHKKYSKFRIDKYFSSTYEFNFKVINEGGAVKLSANWITGDIAAYIKSNRLTFDQLPFQPNELAEMLKMIDSGEISGKIAKEILPELLSKGGSPKQLVQDRGLGMIGDPKVIEEIIDQLILKHPNEVESFRSGKKKLLGFFVGQLMKETKGKADPKLANQILNKKLQG